MERKTVKFEVKQVDEEEGTFEGYAATFSKTPDSYGDIIDKGAFKKTLKERFKRIKILWNHYVLEPIGKPLELAEDEKGLLVKGKLSLGVQRAREVLSLMKDGVITEMSIGYDSMKESFKDGIRHLEEIRLWDVSPVTFAANPDAVITSVKKATGFGNLPLADRDKAWDATACERRVRAWAGGEDNINWNKYRQAFFWFDSENPDLFGSYKLGFADIINNRLTAIPRGIFAVAAVLMGARGGVAIPESDMAGVKSHVEKYYAKMRKEFDDEGIVAPWNKSVEVEELKPLPNEHACRLRDPDDFKKDSFRRMTRKHEDKEYSVIMGRLKGEDTMTDQAFRYDKEVWEEDEAKTHCKDHDGTFEAAEKLKKLAAEYLADGTYHMCKLRELDDFKKETIRTLGDEVEGKFILFIIGELKDDDKVVVQSYRYPVSEWEEEDARKHCKAHEGKLFEAAEKQAKSGRVLSSASLEKVRAALEALQALLEAAESEPEPAKATQLSEEVAEEAAKLEQTITTLKAESEGFDVREAEGRIESILDQLKK